jgi:hypothetical protein
MLQVAAATSPPTTLVFSGLSTIFFVSFSFLSPHKLIAESILLIYDLTLFLGVKSPYFQSLNGVIMSLFDELRQW